MKTALRVLGLILLGLAMGAVWGCATTKTPPTQYLDKSVPYECGEAPAADPYTALPVLWTVETLNTGQKVFSLTGSMYEHLMGNMVGTLAAGQQVRAQRDFYVDCILRSREPSGSAPGPPAPLP